MDRTRSVVNSETAIVLIDLQNDFCHPEGTASKRGKDVHKFQVEFKNMAELLGVAREKNIPVIHVISEHSEWTKSPSKQEMLGRTNQRKPHSYCEPDSWGADIYYLFTPKSEEKIVIKHRYNGFFQTDLELILRANRIKHIIIMGLYTNVCVDTTVRDAYMRDFDVTVPFDCVVSDNEKLNDFALELLKGTFADVIHSSEIKKQLYS